MHARNGLEAEVMFARLSSFLPGAALQLSAIFILLTAACAGNPSSAAMSSNSMPTAPSASSEPRLERISYDSSATKAKRDFFLYVPKGYEEDSARVWPVLLFLHGNGERGNAGDELDYLLVNGPLYEAWIQKRDLPFLIIAPQLPMYGRDEFADYLRDRDPTKIPQRLASGTPARPPEFETPTPMTGAAANSQLPLGPQGPPMGWPELETDVLTILSQVKKNYRVDVQRQYITGVSYGGFGTWYMASRHSEHFAAMAPVVGYGHPELMPTIAKAKLPIWCFAGGRDGGVRSEFFYAGLNRLEELGHHDIKFTIEADMGHDVWARVYAGQDLYSWMLEHSRP